jgi:HEAT repeat protein
MLGRWGDPAPAVAIRALLPRLNEIERCRAIDALGRLGSDEALAGILAHADDPSPHVRKFVARALGKSNAPAAQSKLRAIAEQEPVPYIRRIAAKQLK